MLTYIIGGGTAIGLVTTWYTVTGHLAVTSLLLAAIGVYLALTGGVPYASYRYASRRYRRYTLE